MTLLSVRGPVHHLARPEESSETLDPPLAYAVGILGDDSDRGNPPRTIMVCAAIYPMNQAGARAIGSGGGPIRNQAT